MGAACSGARSSAPMPKVARLCAELGAPKPEWELPPISPAALQARAKQSRKRAAGLDGWRPAHFACLGFSVFQALGALWDVCLGIRSFRLLGSRSHCQGIRGSSAAVYRYGGVATVHIWLLRCVPSAIGYGRGSRRSCVVRCQMLLSTPYTPPFSRTCSLLTAIS